jgi:toxin YoeB
MSYVLVFAKSALMDLEKHKKSGNKVVLKKIEQLLNELRIHPEKGTGQPEALKNKLSGLHSRRINQKHRLIYGIDNEANEVNILGMWNHYADK